MNKSRQAQKERAASLAKALAVQLRDECGIPPDAPLTVRELIVLAARRRISAVRFNAPLASEGCLKMQAGGEFHALIARPANTRGRYTLAHEIGHTYLDSPIPIPSPGSRLADDVPSAGWPNDLEEFFCDTYASELLLPSEVAESKLWRLRSAVSPADFLAPLERISKEYAVSLRMLLIKTYSVGMWPRALLVAVLSAIRPGVDDVDGAVQVLAAYSDPQGGWYMPNNQNAAAAGYQGALILARAWHRGTRSQLGFKNAVGVFQIGEGDQAQRIERSRREHESMTAENLHLKRRERSGAWSRHVVPAQVLYRLYASSPSEAYMLAIAQLLTVRMTTSRGPTLGWNSDHELIRSQLGLLKKT